jgi:hypothetical protein
VLAPAGEFIFDRIYSMIDHYPLAGFQPGYLRAQAGDNSGYVRSAPVRHLEIKARQTSHDPYIEVIQGAGFDFDKDLTFTGNRVGNIIVPENIQAAMLVVAKGFHILFPFGVVIAQIGSCYSRGPALAGRTVPPSRN